MSETLEQHEQAEHAAEGGHKHSALLIAALAAGLAFTEQGAQHAQTAMSESAIAATDLWGQYQAKSIRANQAHDFAGLAMAAAPAGPARDALLAQLNADISRFETDKADGKAAVASRARTLEKARDAAHERLEAFDNGAAALQLAIVLTTASVITDSGMLLLGGFLVGGAGVLLSVLGLVRPEWAAW
ncbi:MAG: DUF4337 family protein [Rhodospirillales bacterium]